MKIKNVVIAFTVVLAVSACVATSTGHVGNNEVSKVPVASADVPLATELPFLYSQLTPVVQKSDNFTAIPEVVEPLVVEPPTPEIKVADFVPYDVPLNDDLQRFIRDTAKEYGIDFELILGIIQVESEFDPKAISYDNSSMGLMQVNVRNTFSHFAIQAGLKSADVFDPYDNVTVGIFYLSYLRGLWEQKGETGERLDKLMILSYRYGFAGSKARVRSSGFNFAYLRKVLEYKSNLTKRGD